MTHDLQRFVDAQDPLWEDVADELKAGNKQSHWMWFVFPQLAGLGTSEMARTYAIAHEAEARAYLAHPVLGPRLREAARWVLTHPDKSADEILGATDAVKLRSCATLFGQLDAEPDVFAEVLVAFYGGEGDPQTLQLLGG